MVPNDSQEERIHLNNEELNESSLEFLLNYECDEEDDGVYYSIAVVFNSLCGIVCCDSWLGTHLVITYLIYKNYVLYKKKN